MKMKQSLAEFERAMASWKIRLIVIAATRCAASSSSAPVRQVERRHKRGSVRFVLLVLTLILTAAIVTVATFLHAVLVVVVDAAEVGASG